jgi:hypothetical protein
VTADELAAAVETELPGAVEAHEEGVDMPTLAIRLERLRDVCLLMRDRFGKNLLCDVVAVDYLGYGEEVAGYFGTERGRDINRTGSWGAPTTAPPARPCRASSRCGRRPTGTSARRSTSWGSSSTGTRT